MDKAAEADAAHAPFRDEQSDFVSYLKLWHAFHDRQKHLSGSKLRKWCQASFVSWVRMREWHDVHAQLREVTGELGLLRPTATRSQQTRPDHDATQPRAGTPTDGRVPGRSSRRRRARGNGAGVRVGGQPAEHAAGRGAGGGDRGGDANPAVGTRAGGSPPATP